MAVASAQTFTERFHAGQIGDIASDTFCPVPTRLQIACDLLNPRFTPARENDGGFESGQPCHDGMPNSTSPSGNHGNCPRERNKLIWLHIIVSNRFLRSKVLDALWRKRHKP